MNIDRAFIHYAAAQKALKDRPASGVIVGLYCGIAYASCEAARTTEAVAAGRQAVAIAEQVGHERVWQQASGALAFALNAKWSSERVVHDSRADKGTSAAFG